jgi:hypothetical protein
VTATTGPELGERPAWLAYLPVSVDAHIRGESVLTVTLHPQEGRLVLSIEGSNNACVHLFTPRAELARLIEVASAGLAELDTATATAEVSETDINVAGAESAA